MTSPLPKWLRSELGQSNILILAPHGGISDADLLAPESWPRKGNDLYTAELAAQMRIDLDARAVINQAMDRNTLDLNRIDQATQDAPFFLAAIEEHLQQILARHEQAIVLIVHGWHITQTKVDIGCGKRLTAAADASHHASKLTCSPEFLTGPIERLRCVLAETGTQATLGEQWPGAHRNNMLQLFRREAKAQAPGVIPPEAHGIRALAASGRIEALQLELAVPLRWAGAHRDHFRRAVRVVLQQASPPEAAPPLPTTSIPTPPEPLQSSLQCVDARTGLTLLMGMAYLPNRTMGARFMCFLPDGRVGIFVGHGCPNGSLQIHGFSLQETASGMRIDFNSHLQLTSDGAGYFQRETHQLRADVLPAKAHLQTEKTLSGVKIVGDFTLGREEFSVQASVLPGPLAGGPFGRKAGLSLYLAYPDGRTEKIHGPAGPLADRGETPNGEAFRIIPEQHIALRRPQKDHTNLLEFGPARFTFRNGIIARGLYENITHR